MPRVFVITGPSSSGKTTTINYLRDMDYPVVREAARDVIDEGLLSPRTPEFQAELAARHLLREKEIRASAHDIVFADRGIYDNTGYCRYFGFKEIPSALKTDIRYEAAFFMEPLGVFRKDGTRIESGLREAVDINKIILEEYRSRNIPCVSVPAMPVEKRAEFILASIANLNQNIQIS